MLPKPPPHDTAAEMSLLGAMLIDPSVIDEVVGIVPDKDCFYHPDLGSIYDAIVRCYERDRCLDLVILRRHLEDIGSLEAVGGDARLESLANGVPVASNARHYAMIVAEKAQLRRVLEACEVGATKVQTDGGAAMELIASVEQSVVTACEVRTVVEPEQVPKLLEKAMNDAGKDAKTGLVFSLSGLRNMLGQLQFGEMTVIGARPSMGKTAMGFQEAVNLARVRPGVFFSLEMTRRSLAHRVLAGGTRSSVHEVREGTVHNGSLLDVVVNAPENLWVDDTPGLTMSMLSAKTRRLMARAGVQWIMVDYLQYLRDPQAARESRYSEVSTISRAIKALAKTLNIHIICLAQLNREVEGRSDFRPKMSDFRSSGEIEQDADNIVLIHREEYYHQNDPNWVMDNPDKAGIAEMIVAKNRNGETGVVKCRWDGRAMRFYESSPFGGGY